MKSLHRLAKSGKWQIVYNRAKDMGSFQLFNNVTDFSALQINFLYYLEMYSSLYTDLATKEPFISEEIIEDDLRAEAYMVWKRAEKERPESANKKNKDKETVTDGSLIFTRKKD